ncbi:hypothetical protein D3C73_1084390 [compost metagenome]
MFLELIGAQPAVAVEPAGRQHHHHARGGRQVVGQRGQHQLHAQGLKARMAIGQHGHLEFVGQIAIGDEAQIVAGQFGRAQDHQPVSRAQRLAQP